MREEMISVDAGWSLTLLAMLFWVAETEVLTGRDFLLFSCVRTEVRGGMTGAGGACWPMVGSGQEISGASHARAARTEERDHRMVCLQLGTGQ